MARIQFSIQHNLCITVYECSGIYKSIFASYFLYIYRVWI